MALEAPRGCPGVPAYGFPAAPTVGCPPPTPPGSKLEPAAGPLLDRPLDPTGPCRSTPAIPKVREPSVFSWSFLRLLVDRDLSFLKLAPLQEQEQPQRHKTNKTHKPKIIQIPQKIRLIRELLVHKTRRQGRRPDRVHASVHQVLCGMGN